MMNMLRQQQNQAQAAEARFLEEHRQSQRSDEGHSDEAKVRLRQEDGRSPTDKGESIGHGSEANGSSRAKWSKSLGGKRGLSSLLMPPSVRRKLEAAAENDSGAANEDETEITAQYLLLQSTQKPNPIADANPYYPNARPLFDESIWKEDSYFTARTDKSLNDTHLRELYRVEQEMNDMCEAMSIYSISEATISEADYNASLSKRKSLSRIF